MASNASIQRLRVFGAEADPSVDAERVCLLTADLAAGSPSSSADGGAASSSALGATPPSPPAITLAWMFYQNLKHSLFGSVKAAVLLTRRRDGSLHATADAQKVAVKVTEKARLLSEPRQEDPRHEIEILRALHPPGERCTNVTALVGDFFDENYLFVLLEFADGGELFDKVAAEGTITEDVARVYFCDIMRGVAYIHSHGICHRDLSLENVMLVSDAASGREVAKIIDFGLALSMPEDGSPLNLDGACGQVGKLPYMAPEVYENRPFDGRAIDIWAVGIMLFTMLVGGPPHAIPTRRDARFEAIVDGRLLEVLTAWACTELVPPPAQDLLNRMLLENGGARLSVAAIDAHAWTRGG